MTTAKNNPKIQQSQKEFTEEPPNAETLAALAETEEMLKNPEKYKRYKSISELMKDLEI